MVVDVPTIAAITASTTTMVARHQALGGEVTSMSIHTSQRTSTDTVEATAGATGKARLEEVTGYTHQGQALKRKKVQYSFTFSYFMRAY